MPNYRTPDVDVKEVSGFPPLVAEVETAVPAFIGYTEKATRIATDDLHLKPTKIFSLKEFEAYFGLPKDDAIDVSVTTSSGAVTAVTVTEPEVSYLLYYSVQMFFANGGGKCYIVSVGTYETPAAVDEAELQAGLEEVRKEDEPTLIVIPEAVKLGATSYGSLMTAVLQQCFDLKDRFGIFDLHDGDVPPSSLDLTANRGHFGNNNLKYGAAYYPFLKTATNHFMNMDETNVEVAVDGDAAADLATFKTSNTAVYNAVKMALQDHYVVLPPSGAVAGVFAATDTARGVWTAPANVSLANVVEPVVKLTSALQESFNVDPTTGKSVNVLHAFAGKGTLVWGARTLAGNDNEWRYVPVRRFFNMVEESVKKSTYWAVFETNDANTWVKVRGMIEKYLTQKWRGGALAGATTKEAFFAHCGLGTTMSAQDILEGRMIVEIGMAVVQPAEFIILRFSHKRQTS